MNNTKKGIKAWREEIKNWNDPWCRQAQLILRDAEYDLAFWPQYSKEIIKDAIECFESIKEDMSNQQALGGACP